MSNSFQTNFSILATTHLGGTFLFECNFDIHDLNLTSELPSYKEILSAWQEIHSTDPSSADEYGNEIIWNNRFIRIDGKSIFFLSWYQKGVIKIRDLLNDGRFLSRAEFQEKYGLKVNFLKYFGLLSAIPSGWKNFLLNSPHIPSNKAVKDYLTPSNVIAKMAREYFVLRVLKSPNIELELVGENLSPKAIYQLPFKVT